MGRRGSRKWAPEEDETVRRLFKIHGPKWSLIANAVNGRSGKQCRERWHNQLDPNIKKDKWTAEEERRLEEAHRKFGNAWAKIAQMLPGRTDNSIKNRWHSTRRRRMRAAKRDKRATPGARQARGRQSSARRGAASAGSVDGDGDVDGEGDEAAGSGGADNSFGSGATGAGGAGAGPGLSAVGTRGGGGAAVGGGRVVVERAGGQAGRRRAAHGRGGARSSDGGTGTGGDSDSSGTNDDSGTGSGSEGAGVGAAWRSRSTDALFLPSLLVRDIPPTSPAGGAGGSGRRERQRRRRGPWREVPPGDRIVANTSGDCLAVPTDFRVGLRHHDLLYNLLCRNAPLYAAEAGPDAVTAAAAVEALAGAETSTSTAATTTTAAPAPVLGLAPSSAPPSASPSSRSAGEGSGLGLFGAVVTAHGADRDTASQPPASPSNGTATDPTAPHAPSPALQSPSGSLLTGRRTPRSTGSAPLSRASIDGAVGGGGGQRRLASSRAEEGTVAAGLGGSSSGTGVEGRVPSPSPPAVGLSAAGRAVGGGSPSLSTAGAAAALLSPAAAADTRAGVRPDLSTPLLQVRGRACRVALTPMDLSRAYALGERPVLSDGADVTRAEDEVLAMDFGSDDDDDDDVDDGDDDDDDGGDGSVGDRNGRGGVADRSHRFGHFAGPDGGGAGAGGGGFRGGRALRRRRRRSVVQEIDALASDDDGDGDGDGDRVGARAGFLGDAPAAKAESGEVAGGTGRQRQRRQHWGGVRGDSPFAPTPGGDGGGGRRRSRLVASSQHGGSARRRHAEATGRARRRGASPLALSLLDGRPIAPLMAGPGGDGGGDVAATHSLVQLRTTPSNRARRMRAELQAAAAAEGTRDTGTGSSSGTGTGTDRGGSGGGSYGSAAAKDTRPMIASASTTTAAAAAATLAGTPTPATGRSLRRRRHRTDTGDPGGDDADPGFSSPPAHARKRIRRGELSSTLDVSQPTVTAGVVPPAPASDAPDSAAGTRTRRQRRATTRAQEAAAQGELSLGTLLAPDAGAGQPEFAGVTPRTALGAEAMLTLSSGVRGQ